MTDKVYDLGIFLAMLKRAAPFQGQYHQEAIATGLALCEDVRRVLAECDRIERHIAENVPHLEPTAGTMSIGKIRALLRSSATRATAAASSASATAEARVLAAAIERVRALAARRVADDDGRGSAAVSVSELLHALDGEP